MGRGLGGLASLVALRAANNAIAELPDQLRRLGRLELLDLADNRLQALPPSLTSCTSLRVLRAPRNALVRLCPGPRTCTHKTDTRFTSSMLFIRVARICRIRVALFPIRSLSESLRVDRAADA